MKIKIIMKRKKIYKLNKIVSIYIYRIIFIKSLMKVLTLTLTKKS